MAAGTRARLEAHVARNGLGDRVAGPKADSFARRRDAGFAPGRDVPAGPDSGMAHFRRKG